MNTKTIYIVIQEGGSSIEAYATSYDTKDDALDAMVDHATATYRSAGPFPVTIHQDGQKCYIAEPDVLELLNVVKIAEYEYATAPLSAPKEPSESQQG